MLEFPDRPDLRGDRLLVATGRRPRADGLGLETVGIEPGQRGIAVDARMNAGDGVWAIGDVTGIWPLTYVSKYHGRVAAANILGAHARPTTRPCRGWSSPIPRPPRWARPRGAHATVPLAEFPRTSTYTRAYDPKPGFMTLVSDGDRLTGAYALGPEAGEWLQQATVAIRAQHPLEVMDDVIQPFPDLLRGVPSRAVRAEREGPRGGVSVSPGEPRRLTRVGPRRGGSLVAGAVAAALFVTCPRTSPPSLPPSGAASCSRLSRSSSSPRPTPRPARRSPPPGCSPARSCMSLPTGGSAATPR